MTGARSIDPDEAARLIERLLAEPALRERFRRDPVRVCRKLGLDALADELAQGGPAAQTLELRESRSSLAGVLMAAAVEGIAVAQVLDQARAAGGALAEAAGRVTLPDLPSIPDPRGGGGAAPSAQLASTAEPDADAGGGGGEEASRADAALAAPVAEPSSSGAAAAAPAGVEPASAAESAPATSPAAPADAAPATTPDEAAAPDAPAPTTPAIPPTPATPEAAALLASSRLQLDAVAQLELTRADASPRAIALLTALAADHDLAVSMSGERPGAFDITELDGEPIRAANMAARDLAEQLAERAEAERPLAIASPWPIDGPAFRHDPSVDDRLRITFAEPDRTGASTSTPDPQPVARAATATPRSSPAPPEPSRAAPADVEPATARGGAVAAARPEAPTDDDDLTFAEPVARRSAEAAEAGDRDDLAFAIPGAQEPVARRSAMIEADAVDGLPTVGEYPGDGAPRSELAAWMATQAKKRGLPPELPVMASLVESGLQNLNHGDRDSVGFFQMRLGIWNSGAYRGYPERPELQLKWFLDTASEVRDQRVARGQPIDDPAQFGEWIADVERPAAQYRGRYQLRLDEARDLLREHARPVAAAPEPAAAEPAVVEVAAPTGDALGDAVLAHPHLHLDDVGRGDIRAGRLDPRILTLLLRLADDHDLRISCTKSDHSQFTAGGSVSNHFHGRALDIAFVDGEIVNGASPKSRALAEHLATLPAAIRPDEVGTPWPIASPGYFTDAGHQDHLHVGFKTELPSGWKPPAGAVAEPAAQQTSLAPSGLQARPSAAADADDLDLAAPSARRANAPATDDDGLQLPTAEASPASPAPAAAGATADPAGADAAATPSAAVADATAADDAAPTVPRPSGEPVAERAVATPASDAQPADDDGLQLEPRALAERAASAEQGERDSLALPVAGGAEPAAARRLAEPLAPMAVEAPAGYPGDDAERAALARWLGAQARRHGLPPELPVMAALVESGLQNLNYGDRDSVGFFQMRTGIWDQGPYAGYADRPDLQARWFIDQALAVRRQRIAAGDTNFGGDASQWGEWIADIERPAEQYRGRYQLRLAEARRLLGG